MSGGSIYLTGNRGLLNKYEIKQKACVVWEYENRVFVEPLPSLEPRSGIMSGRAIVYILVSQSLFGVSPFEFSNYDTNFYC